MINNNLKKNPPTKKQAQKKIKSKGFLIPEILVLVTYCLYLPVN